MKQLFYFLTIALFISCTNGETDEYLITNKKEIKLVTGINLINDIGQPLQVYGNPNTFNINSGLVIFPTVTQNSIEIQSNNAILKTWIVKCKEEKIYENVDFTSILNSDTYSGEIITANSERIIEDNATNILINISDLESGYYKVFVKTDIGIFWEIIYKPSLEDQYDVIESYWN